MRIKEEWTKIPDRKLAGDFVVIRQGRLGSDLSNMLRMNDTGIFLWHELAGRDFDAADVCHLLEDAGFGPKDALKDAEAFIEQLRKCELLDE